MKEIKLSEEDAPAKVLAASQGNVPPRLAHFTGDNCGCGGVMVLQPYYPSQPYPDHQEFKCGMCGKIEYQHVGPRPIREESDQPSDSEVEAS